MSNGIGDHYDMRRTECLCILSLLCGNSYGKTDFFIAGIWSRTYICSISGIGFRKESWNVGSGTELYPLVWSSIYSIFNNNILCRKGQEEEN